MLKQLFRFLGVSGLGWCLDFSIYLCLTLFFGWPVFWANCAGGLPAITLVFIVSTRKIFRQGGGLPLWAKYLLYLVYQGFLLVAASALASALTQPLCRLLAKVPASLPVLRGTAATPSNGTDGLTKTLSKLIVTPATMLCNFCVMKLLSERC